MKQFFTQVVGDIKFQLPSDHKPDDPAVMVKTEFIKPTLKASLNKQSNTKSLAAGTDSSMTTMSSTATMNADNTNFEAPNEIFGLNVKYDDLRKETWRNMYKLLGAYCEFKKSTENQNKDLFEKDFVNKKIEQSHPGLLNQVSSNNLKVSLNVIDQIFKLWVQTTTDPRQPTLIQCQFGDAESDMPEDGSVTESGDTCKEGEAKKCRRNKWLYRFVDIIALDKLIDQSKETYETAMRGALSVDTATALSVNQLFCASLQQQSSNRQDPLQCDIGFFFDSVSGYNRQRWSDQLEAAAKLAQSIGGSSNFRFQPNNSLATGAGGSTDSRGDVSPGAGEGNS
jgi:hypothetical protein